MVSQIPYCTKGVVSCSTREGHVAYSQYVIGGGFQYRNLCICNDDGVTVGHTLICYVNFKKTVRVVCLFSLPVPTYTYCTVSWHTTSMHQLFSITKTALPLLISIKRWRLSQCDKCNKSMNCLKVRCAYVYTGVQTAQAVTKCDC